MSEKKKIKINVDSEEESADPKTEAAAPKSKESSDITEEKPGENTLDGPIKDLENQLNAKDKEAKETYDRLLRVSADFENYKKRSAREMDDFRKFANQSLLKEMLSVVDNLELAINSANEKQKSESSLKEGLDLTLKEILRVFEKFSVTPIESKGKSFDPTYHEAVMQEETDEHPENTVITEMQKGYLLHDRLLRPAMVVVAKPSTKASDSKPSKKTNG
ncbi:MAG: nucleotide exchange factor GrpE [Desulfobacterales bacterium]|jgi:molecular chaperone GrpE